MESKYAAHGTYIKKYIQGYFGWTAMGIIMYCPDFPLGMKDLVPQLLEMLLVASCCQPSLGSDSFEKSCLT